MSSPRVGQGVVGTGSSAPGLSPSRRGALVVGGTGSSVAEALGAVTALASVWVGFRVENLRRILPMAVSAMFSVW